MGGERRCAGSDDGKEQRGDIDTAAVPVSPVCRLQGKRRSERCCELGLQSAGSASQIEVGQDTVAEVDASPFGRGILLFTVFLYTFTRRHAKLGGFLLAPDSDHSLLLFQELTSTSLLFPAAA